MNDTSNVGVNSAQQPSTAPVSPQPVAPVAPATPVAPAPVAPQPTVQSTPEVAAPQPAVQTTVSAPVSPQPVAPVAPATPVAPAPVAPAAVVTPVEPAPSAPEAVTPKEESKVEVQLADNIKIDTEKKKDKKEKKKDNSDDDDDEMTSLKANKYPIILAVVFVSILLLLFVYYYLVMTPYNVFDSALTSMVTAIKNGVNNFGEDDSDRNTFDLKFDLKTDQSQFKDNSEQQPIDYINGDTIQGIVNFDTKTKGFSVELLARKNHKNLPEGIEPVETKQDSDKMLDVKLYSLPESMYIGPIYYRNLNDSAAAKNEIKVDKTVQVSIGTDSEDRTFSIDSFTMDSFKYGAELVDLIIEKGKTTVKESDLKRSIVFKKVGDSTAIALKANCDTHEDMIKRVFYGTFDEEFINRKEVIELTQKVFGLDEKEAKDLLNEVHTHPTDFSHLDINLYMNLANTELISFDMTFDEKFYIEVDYLKGFYSIIIRIMNDGNEENDTLNIRADYDRDNGIVDGIGFINNDNTFIAVKFDYIRKISTTGEKVGNSLNFKFYNNKTYLEANENKRKPFCELDCTLDIYESNNEKDKENTNFNLEEEVKNAFILPVSQYKTSSGLIIKSTIEDAPKISGLEGASIINFEKGFTSHVTYVVDHLLYNKEGALARRDNKAPETSADVVEEKVEEKNEKVEETTESTETIESAENNTENNEAEVK